MSTSAITRAELDAALDDVLAAPKTDAPLETLCLRPALNKRQMVEAISFTRAEAIAGDRWLSMPWLRTEEGAPHPGIQVSILPSRVMDLVWRAREATPISPSRAAATSRSSSR